MKSILTFFNRPRAALLLFACLFASTVSGEAADWQWSSEVGSMTVGKSATHPRAFLWIPPDCRQVRGIVFGQNNMLEEGILQDAEFRRTLAELGFAEIFVTPTLDNWQKAGGNDAANAQFDALLKTFAEQSGYAELAFAPIVPIGHSAMASFPWNFAAWNPRRTMAILSVHGDVPQTTRTGNGRPNLDWGERNIDGIPGAMIMGEYEWLEDRLLPAFAFRAKYPGAPLTVFCDAGNGHFNSSRQLLDFLCLFIRDAAARRLPKNAPLNEPVTLTPVEPQDGWLVDCWRENEPVTSPPAPCANYAGDRTKAFWCFDGDMARFIENCYSGSRGKLPQLVDVAQDGKSLPPNPKAFELVRVQCPPLDDSLTFRLQGAFLDAVPPGNPEKWTGLASGAPLGHATDGGPVTLSRITGPVEQLNADTFAIRFNRLSLPADRRYGEIWLFARHPGDAKYKNAVEQALLRIPVSLTEGAEQTITFPQIPDQTLGTKSLKLTATSSAGAPVYYYVLEGPAEIDGAVLKFTKIPPRAKFPLKVTVVAWQYGRTSESRLKSAEPVATTFYIKR